jgi:hypothetical protein
MASHRAPSPTNPINTKLTKSAQPPQLQTKNPNLQITSSQFITISNLQNPYQFKNKPARALPLPATTKQNLMASPQINPPITAL